MRQGKKMYKDPPLLPPGGVVIEAKSAPPPKQNALTGELTFAPRDNGGPNPPPTHKELICLSYTAPGEQRSIP